MTRRTRKSDALMETLEPRLLLDAILLADFGDAAENNSFGTSWATVYKGPYTDYSANGPDGITGGSTGNFHCAGISGATGRAFAAGDQVKVTWYNNAATSKTFTPKISFDDLDYDGTGDTGTWYTMSQMTVLAGQSMTAVFTFDAGTAGTYYNVTTSRATNNITDVLIDKIEYQSATTVSISATDASAAEPSNTGTFTVTRSGSTSGALTVNYTVSGTATNGTDYSTLSGSVVIPDGQASATITLTPTNDSTVEGTETAILTLASGSGYTVGSPNSATVNIADDDVFSVTISATDSSAAEPSNTGTFTVTRSGGTSGALTVNYNVSGTATNGSDYSSLSGSVVIPDGQASATITVTPTDDAEVESTESVILTLASGSGYTVGSPSSATVNIADDDVSQDVLLVNYGDSAGNNVFGTSWNTVYLGPWTGYAGDGPDGITGGSTGNYHTAGISGGTARTFAAGDQVVVTWYNRSASSKTFTPKISFDDLDYDGSGDAGTWYTLAQMTVPAGQTATAIYTFDAGTAGDYYNVNVSRGTSNVTDMLIDKIEHVGGQVGAPTVTIAATDASAAEPSNTGTFTVTRAGGTSGNLTVNYSVSGTATNGSDYSSLGGSVVIPDGQASATITVSPINDATVESTETVILTVTSGGGYTVGSPSSATVNITDDDSVSVSIAATDASAAEPSNTGTFTVTRAGGTSGNLTVNYSVSGTATNGSDYSSLGGSVVIPDGQASATITVSPINDATVESTETVILTVTSGGGYTVGSPSSATVNIADDDGTFNISGVTGTINHRLPITISGAGFGGGPGSLVFDDFEGGVDGTAVMTGPGSAVVGQWDSIAGGTTYQNDYTVSGNMAWVGDMSVSNASKVVRNFPAGTDEVFASWWVRVPEVIPGEGGEGTNWKHVWILGATTVDDDFTPTFLADGILINSNCGITSTYTNWNVGDEFERGDWVRMTVYLKGGLTDGTYTMTMLNPRTGVRKSVTMASGKTWGGDTTHQYESINFNGYGRQTDNCLPRWDDCYPATGSNCRARVEIGNASTYANCTNLSVCGVTGWSSTSIDAQLNFGSLNTSGPLYLYVIDAAGNVSPGYQLTVSQAPQAYNDKYVMSSGATLNVSSPGVIGNDIDLQGQNMTATKLSNPAHGSVTLNSNGSFSYTPSAGYYGTDSFTYRVSDGSNNSNTATVTLEVRQKMVDFGDSAPNNTFGTAWNTVFKGPYVTYNSAGPDGLLGGSTGGTAYMGVSGSGRTFNTGETVLVTWYNNGTGSITFTPVVSFDDPDAYGSGTAGTWYSMNTITIAPGQTMTTRYTLASGGVFSRINVCRNISNRPELLCDKIEIV